MAGLSCQEALTRYKYDARFTPKKEGEKNVLVGALKRSALQVPMDRCYGLVGSSSACRLVSALYGVLKQL